MYLILSIIFSIISIGNAQPVDNGTEKLKTQYTVTETKALEKFRPMVAHLIPHDYEKSDAYLIPWLRAVELEVPEAVKKFHTYRKWRKEKNIDNIKNESIVEFNPPPYEVAGHDREGHPILTFIPTSIDLRKLSIQSGGTGKLYRLFIQLVERGLAQRRPSSLKLEKEITQAVVIIDFSGFNLRQHGCISCVPVFRDLFIAFENYYPGVLKYIVLINVPRIALPILELLKPLMSEGTQKALKVFGPDREKWSAFLLAFIEPDQLPYRFGGIKVT